MFAQSKVQAGIAPGELRLRRVLVFFCVNILGTTEDTIECDDFSGALAAYVAILYNTLSPERILPGNAFAV